MLKRLITFFALIAILTTSANAHDFEVDGIYYVKNSDGTTVSVSHKGITASYFSNEYSGSVTIPPSVTYSGITYSVTSIGEYAFYECSGLTSVTIPNSVTEIGHDAFCLCLYLTSAAIPNSVTSIGNGAFWGCSGLTSVTIPNSVTSIGWGAFENCSGLLSICVEGGNPAYDSRGNCNAIIETASNTLIIGCNNSVIPNSVTSIGNSAFNGYSGLTSIEIPNSVTSIGTSAFSGCSGLTSIEIPNSVTSIGNFTFNGCSGLTSVTIPNSATSIGSYAFRGCSGLTSVTIPNSVTSIGNYAFERCSGLTSIIVEDRNPAYDSRGNCNAIIETASNTLIVGCKNTAIPNSVTSIGTSAFSGCSGLTSIEIPNSVTSIGTSAFSGCSGLTSVTIPNSVTSIGGGAFWGCNGLTSVTNYALTPQPIDDTVFECVYIHNCKLYIWLESLNAYMTANVWKNFIIQYLGSVEGIEVDQATKEVEGYYNPQGIRFNKPASGQVNVVRYKDGSAKKVIIK